MILAKRKWTMLTMNKASKKYYKNLKIFLPIHGKIEKQLFNNIFLRLSELNNTNPDITYEEICIELGSPQEIVAEYFYNTDTTYLSQMLRYSHSYEMLLLDLLLFFSFCLAYASIILIKRTKQ